MTGQKHRETTRREFTRQAENFASAPVLRAAEITQRIVDVVGDGPCARVIDIACGPGLVTEALAPAVGHVIGVDLTREPLRLARERLGPERAGFVCGLGEATPFADASFDVAVLRLALHHFDHPAAVLEEVRRLLRPGGRLVVLDVLATGPPPLQELRNALERLRDPSHVRMVSQLDLHSQIEAAKLAVHASETWIVPRSYREWMKIIDEPVRTQALEVVLRSLLKAGVDTGLALYEKDDEIWIRYEWCLITAIR